MPLPNFFIIGAPKAGSTALYDTLSQHPQIYMSPVKEPLFFACEGEPPLLAGPLVTLLRRRAIWQPAQYLALFEGVKEERAIGEASVIYLRSPQAAARIQHNIPCAKLVAVLRHPAERAHSHFWFSVKIGAEPARSFEEALEQEARGERDGWFSGLHHRENGFYHRQLAAYYALFPREQIKVYLYEEWQTNPRALLRDLFQFLEVEAEFAPILRRTNVTSVPRSRRLQAWAQRPQRFEARLNRVVPRTFHAPIMTAVQAANHRFNQGQVPSLNSLTRTRLVQEYREDILKLQDLIERDLSHWLTGPQA